MGCLYSVGDASVSDLQMAVWNWKVYDFDDTIPVGPTDPIWDYYGKSLVGKNKCLIIHLDAEVLRAKRKSLGNVVSTYNVISGIYPYPREFRIDQYQRSHDGVSMLGDPTPKDPMILAELMSHVPDISNLNRDRDRKSMWRFPISDIGG